MLTTQHKASWWTNTILFVVAFAMPFVPKFQLTFLVILLILFLFNKDKEHGWFKASGNGTAILMILFYLYHVAGLFWTDNFSAAALDLQIKLPLLIFPLVIFYGPLIDRSVRYKIYSFFIYGLEGAIYFCLARAFFFYFYDGSNNFLYKDFSYFIHPGYFSMYLCMGSVILLQRLLTGISMISFVVALQWYRLSLFTLAIILLASKAGIFVQLSILIIAFIIAGWYLNRRILKNILIPGLLGMALIYFGLFSPVTSGRMNELQQTMIRPPSSEVHSTAMRLQTWRSAMQVIRERPMAGSGTGDSKSTLMNKYQDNGYTEIYNLKLNAHNQYLQSAVTLGIPGLLLFLSILLSGLYKAFKHKNVLFLSFLLITGLNFMVEAVLEVSAGALFFGFFYSLLSTESRVV